MAAASKNHMHAYMLGLVGSKGLDTAEDSGSLCKEDEGGGRMQTEDSGIAPCLRGPWVGSALRSREPKRG